MNPDVEALTKRLARLEAQHTELQKEMTNARQRFRILVVVSIAVSGAGVWSFGGTSVRAQGNNGVEHRVAVLEENVSALNSTTTNQTTSIASLQHSNTALSDKTQFFAIATDPLTGTLDLYVTGTNLHVVNGSGNTAIVNGLGNLIVGYNDSRVPSGNPDVRTGSHNLIVGERNNYTSYGGIVHGDYNTSDGGLASVFGGFANTAHSSSLVFGGSGNVADEGGAVFGGQRNEAQLTAAAVFGGSDNFAGSFEGNAVFGGSGNRVVGEDSTIVGGKDNRVIAGDHATVVGAAHSF